LRDLGHVFSRIGEGVIVALIGVIAAVVTAG
jgi:hypothetical protein